MPAPNILAAERLFRLLAGRHAALIDVRSDEDAAADPRLLPGARRKPAETVPEWGPELSGQSAVIYCAEGHARSEGVAAWLRSLGVSAEILAGGFAGWRAAGLPLVPENRIPPRDDDGATLWVTRSRPKSIGLPAPGSSVASSIPPPASSS